MFGYVYLIKLLNLQTVFVVPLRNKENDEVIYCSCVHETLQDLIKSSHETFQVPMGSWKLPWDPVRHITRFPWDPLRHITMRPWDPSCSHETLQDLIIPTSYFHRQLKTFNFDLRLFISHLNLWVKIKLLICALFKLWTLHCKFNFDFFYNFFISIVYFELQMSSSNLHFQFITCKFNFNLSILKINV